MRSIEDFIFSAASCGASYVFTVMEPIMCNEETIAKVRQLHASGREVERQISGGASRADLEKSVMGGDASGYWERWNGYRKV